MQKARATRANDSAAVTGKPSRRMVAAQLSPESPRHWTLVCAWLLLRHATAKQTTQQQQPPNGQQQEPIAIGSRVRPAGP